VDTTDVAGVDPPFGHPGEDVVPKRVVANFGGKSNPGAQLRRGHGDVRGASPDRLSKTLVTVETNVRFIGVKVNTDATHTENVKLVHYTPSRVGATMVVRYSREALTW